MIALVFKAVRADIVAEVMTFPHPVFEIEMKQRLFTRPVKIIYDTEALLWGELCAV